MKENVYRADGRVRQGANEAFTGKKEPKEAAKGSGQAEGSRDKERLT